MINVSSTIKSATFLQKAEALAIKLNVPFVDDIKSCTSEMVLCYTEEGLKLHQVDNTRGKITELLFIDFVSGKHGYRRKQNKTIKQPLAKATGIKAGTRPTIFDATAGLGGDSFVLATLGCKVTLCERNQVVAALLEDGIERAHLHPETSSIAQRLTFVEGDSLACISRFEQVFDTVYLDPMFPHSDNSALNKKEMRVIRKIVGDDQDGEELFRQAFLLATKRVVVKRPRLAPPIVDEKISYQLKMKSGRYDIYLKS